MHAVLIYTLILLISLNSKYLRECMVAGKGCGSDMCFLPAVEEGKEDEEEKAEEEAEKDAEGADWLALATYWRRMDSLLPVRMIYGRI
jgi:hypothetical protein